MLSDLLRFFNILILYHICYVKGRPRYENTNGGEDIRIRYKNFMKMQGVCMSSYFCSNSYVRMAAVSATIARIGVNSTIVDTYGLIFEKTRD